MFHDNPGKIFSQEQPRPDPIGAEDESFYSVDTTASATECTGLMPAIPYTEDGRKHLSELMAIHGPPEVTEREDLSRAPGMRESARREGARN